MNITPVIARLLSAIPLLKAVDNQSVEALSSPVADTEEIRKQRIFPGLEMLDIGEHITVRTYLKEHVLRYVSRGSPQADETIGIIGILSGPRDSRLYNLRSKIRKEMCASLPA